MLQSERNALLFVDVLRSYAAKREFLVHDFVVMPNYVHLLITVHGETTIERALQLIKGGFSYRLKKEFGYEGEVWQRGFSEIRVHDTRSHEQHRDYIAQNPVKAGLVNSAEAYAFCHASLSRIKVQGLRPVKANSLRHG